MVSGFQIRFSGNPNVWRRDAALMPPFPDAISGWAAILGIEVEIFSETAQGE